MDSPFICFSCDIVVGLSVDAEVLSPILMTWAYFLSRWFDMMASIILCYQFSMRATSLQSITCTLQPNCNKFCAYFNINKSVVNRTKRLGKSTISDVTDKIMIWFVLCLSWPIIKTASSFCVPSFWRKLFRLFWNAHIYVIDLECIV